MIKIDNLDTKIAALDLLQEWRRKIEPWRKLTKNMARDRVEQNLDILDIAIEGIETGEIDSIPTNGHDFYTIPEDGGWSQLKVNEIWLAFEDIDENFLGKFQRLEVELAGCEYEDGMIREN